MSEFEGKVVYITGGASGMGRSTALRLSGEGAKVFIIDKNAEKLEKVKAEIEAAGGTVATQVGDVTNDDDVQSSVQATVAAFGRLDCAVNNAGITGPIGPLADYDLAAVREIIAIDLTAVISCMQAQFKVMIPQGGGSIVNLSSIWGLTAGGNFVAYTAAKHGVAGATKAGALEVAEQGIRVNAIAPGFTFTPMIYEQGLMIQKGTQEYKDAAANHPMNRWGEPEDMAEGIAFLLSDRASFITGTVLSIDGGFVAR